MPSTRMRRRVPDSRLMTILSAEVGKQRKDVALVSVLPSASACLMRTIDLIGKHVIPTLAVNA